MKWFYNFIKNRFSGSFLH